MNQQQWIALCDAMDRLNVRCTEAGKGFPDYKKHDWVGTMLAERLDEQGYTLEELVWAADNAKIDWTDKPYSWVWSEKHMAQVRAKAAKEANGGVPVKQKVAGRPLPVGEGGLLLPVVVEAADGIKVRVLATDRGLLVQAKLAVAPVTETAAVAAPPVQKPLIGGQPGDDVPW